MIFYSISKRRICQVLCLQHLENFKKKDLCQYWQINVFSFKRRLHFNLGFKALVFFISLSCVYDMQKHCDTRKLKAPAEIHFLREKIKSLCNDMLKWSLLKTWNHKPRITMHIGLSSSYYLKINATIIRATWPIAAELHTLVSK